MPLSSTKNCIFASYLKKTKIMRIKLISVVILFVLLLGACSAPKDVVYLQGVDTLTPEQISQMIKLIRLVSVKMIYWRYLLQLRIRP